MSAEGRLPDYLRPIYNANMIIAFISLALLFLFEAFVFFKLRFKMDNAAISLLLIFLLITLERALLPFLVLFQENDFQRNALTNELLFIIASLISYALLYYFVFEMMIIRAALSSQNKEEQIKREKSINL
jgi:phosphotransferase system  glucose/maltose/N-acetylglucosamine-specific IIC component